MDGHTLCFTLGEDLGHAVELALDALETAGDTDGIVEDCIFSVVGVCLF